jgi:hypothetical protein
MIRPIITAFVLFVALGTNLGNAEQSVNFKNFASFRQLVTGIDFYASNRQLVVPYEKQAAEAMSRLRSLFGADLPKGAIFICSTLEQKDSVYEPKVLRMGYGWTLTAITPEVRMQQMQARIKSQMGGELPAEIVERLKSRATEMMADAEKQMVSTTTQQIAHAVIQCLLVKDLQYRSSRLDDMGKSPLPDWLDIGIASYASGAQPNLAFLQQHMDQTFPLEDILSMSRPFVASSVDQGSYGMNRGGGGGMGRFGGGANGESGGFQGMQGMPQGGWTRGQGGFGGGGGQRGGQRNLPKDEQDRMLFDGQSSTFFSYLFEKVGIERIKVLLAQAEAGKESREFVTQPDVLGADFEKIEADWANWVKTLKP